MRNIRAFPYLPLGLKSALYRGILFFLSFTMCLPAVLPAQTVAPSAAFEMAEALAASQNDLIGPAGTERFGTATVVLPNGNLVVTDPFYDVTTPFLIEDAGGVFLYNGNSGALISTLQGDEPSDQIGNGGVTVLANGKYVVSSPYYGNFRGAASLCSPIDGCGSTVTPGNSLIGSAPGDNVSDYGIKALANGDYVVRSASWNNARGAATYGKAASGASGTISPANSLVGSNSGDLVGDADVIVLPNGNYVVLSRYWNGVGAATFGNASLDGARGAVSAANSLVGGSGDDFANAQITILSNGNYVVANSVWNNGAAQDAGAATWGSKTAGVSGAISESNSLVGTQTGDQIAGAPGVVALTNGNYVVGSAKWNNETGAASWGNGATGSAGAVSATNSLIGTNTVTLLGGGEGGGIFPLSNGNYVVSCPSCGVNNLDTGAVTWGNGATGTSGAVSALNSLYGPNAFDSIGRFVLPLPNGNYVVASEFWNNARGAVTILSGAAATSATVTAANSRTGVNPNDFVGSGKLLLLTDGNYVVFSPKWNNNLGAATWMNGTASTTGNVTAANSLTGTNLNDKVGSGFGIALTNGNYVVQSPGWNGGRGAATWRDGAASTSATVSSANSLVGNSAGDAVGQSVVSLTNGNYVVVSPNVRNGTILKVGAVTWSSGTAGISGIATPGNSLIGTTAEDNIGNAGVTALPNGNYVVVSSLWDRGTIRDAGAVTYGAGNGGTTIGALTVNNSVRGASANSNFSRNFTFDQANDRLVVSRPNDNRVSFFRPTVTAITNGDSNNGRTWDYGAIVKLTDVVVPSPRTVTLESGTPVRDATVDVGGILAVSGDNAVSGTVKISGTLDLSGGKLDVGGNIVIVNCGGTIAGASSGHYILGSLQQCVNSANFNFPVGTANGYSPVQLSNVIGGGNFTVKAVQSQYGQTIGLPSGRLQRYWTLSNGGLSQADVTFNYLEADVASGTAEANYKAYKINPEEAVSHPTLLNASANTAAVAGVTSFSDWTLADSNTVTPFAIKGQLTHNGAGLSGATVFLSGSTNDAKQTDSAGHYSFIVNSGGDYAVAPSLTNYIFAPENRTFEDLNSSQSADFAATRLLSLSGVVRYATTPENQPDRFVPGVLISTNGNVSPPTDQFGVYVLNNLPEGGDYTVTPMKNTDVKSISALDATLVLRHLAAGGQGANVLNENQKLAADANNSGSVSALDATLILRYVASGTNAASGVVGQWKFAPEFHSYDSLSNSLANENFTAILIGEVNGSWTP